MKDNTIYRDRSFQLTAIANAYAMPISQVEQEWETHSEQFSEKFIADAIDNDKVCRSFGNNINDPSFNVFAAMGYLDVYNTDSLELDASDKYVIIEKSLNLERARIEDEFGLTPIEAIIKREDMLDEGKEGRDRLYRAMDYVVDKVGKGTALNDINPENYVEDMNSMLTDDFTKGVESIQADTGIQK